MEPLPILEGTNVAVTANGHIVSKSIASATRFVLQFNDDRQ